MKFRILKVIQLPKGGFHPHQVPKIQGSTSLQFMKVIKQTTNLLNLER